MFLLGNFQFYCFLLLSFSLFAVPNYEQVVSDYSPSEQLFYDRNGTPLQALRTRYDYRSEKWTSIEQISPFLISAVLQSEDRNFFTHNGIDSLAFLGSIWRRMWGSPLRGGSTITMQLVGLLDSQSFPKGRKSLSQKLKQIQRASEIEGAWTKEQILSAYLNLVYFRGELRGIRSASLALFKKIPIYLTANQSYLLAVLIRSPETSVEKVMLRGCLLKFQLEAMVENDCSDLELLVKETLFRGVDYPSNPNYAPHFAQYLRKRNSTPDLRTSISKQLQIEILAILQNQLRPLKAQMVDDGAVLVIHNNSGQVFAYVANTGSMSETSSLDLIQTKRQAGSTLKPFVYAQSFEERKLTPTSILNDAPIDLHVFRGIYRPLNYDKIFLGKVSVTQSLGSSLNIPAVRVLSYLDMGKFIHTLSRLGFNGLAYPEFYGPSLALGTADVSLWDLTNAYRTLANGGVYSDPKLLLEDNATRIDRNADTKYRVFREGVSYLITQILSDREARALSFGWESNLSTRFFTAVKTGTSQDMRDNWCVGYSSEFTVGVWVGNVKGSPMRDVSGISGAGPIWREVMELLHTEKPSVSPNKPDSIFFSPDKKVYYEKGMEGIEDSFVNLGDKKIQPKIISPTNETIFAFDPDIPKDRQIVLFRLNVYSKKWQWFLNNQPIAQAENPFFWNLKKGSFTLALSDENGTVLDRVSFEVR